MSEGAPMNDETPDLWVDEHGAPIWMRKIDGQWVSNPGFALMAEMVAETHRKLGEQLRESFATVWR